MKGKLILSVLFSAALLFTAEAARYARYNMVGYFPNGGKKLVVMSDEDCAGEKWSVKDNSGKEVLSGTVSASKIGVDKATPMKFNHVIDFSSLSTEGKYSFEMEGIKDVKLNIGKDLYKRVIESNLRWIKVQRSSDKDALDKEPSHFGDTACFIYRLKGADSKSGWTEHKDTKKIDLSGGWFDGSVFTKTTVTEAATVYSLLKAYQNNPSLFKKKLSKTDLVDILDEAKWGLDYLCKVMPDDEEFIVSCGGFEDNYQGLRLPHEDVLEGKRRAYSAHSFTQIGSASAALALGSVVFKEAGKTTDAERYLEMAKKMFDASKKAKTAIWMQDSYDLFKDDSSWDNMLLGAIELYKATGDEKYLTKAKSYASKVKSTIWPLYANQIMAGHFSFMEKNPASKKAFAKEVSGFKENLKKPWNFWRIPFGYEFSTTYGCMEVATYALLHAQNGGDDSFNDLAVDVLDFIFGVNAWGLSFVALEDVKSIKKPFSPIYILQSHLFPEGAVPVGPLDGPTHKSESKWIAFDPRSMEENKFNTKDVVYLDHSDDYMTSDVHTYGVADAVYFLSLITSVMGK